LIEFHSDVMQSGAQDFGTATAMAGKQARCDAHERGPCDVPRIFLPSEVYTTCLCANSVGYAAMAVFTPWHLAIQKS
jgi:hypothetical protein